MLRYLIASLILTATAVLAGIVVSMGHELFTSRTTKSNTTTLSSASVPKPSITSNPQYIQNTSPIASDVPQFASGATTVTILEAPQNSTAPLIPASPDLSDTLVRTFVGEISAKPIQLKIDNSGPVVSTEYANLESPPVDTETASNMGIPIENPNVDVQENDQILSPPVAIQSGPIPQKQPDEPSNEVLQTATHMARKPQKSTIGKKKTTVRPYQASQLSPQISLQPGEFIILQPNAHGVGGRVVPRDDIQPKQSNGLGLYYLERAAQVMIGTYR